MTTLYTSADVAERLGIIPRRVRQLADELKIGTKVGRDWLFSDAEIAVLAQRKTAPGPKRSKNMN